ncbi:MAG: class I SAM-dependent methyltransferase [Polyangiales bacterium]
MNSPAHFYSGLIVDVYEALATVQARADSYAPFLQRSGTPALELGCGSGRPLLELLELGHAVEGLDASLDMLERCRAEAAARGLIPTLHHAEMQSFALARRYRSIFLAGASFTLLTTDDDARRALSCIHTHLEPGGSVLIPLEIPDIEQERSSLGRCREVTSAVQTLRCTALALEVEADGRNLRKRLRYERTRRGQATEVVERDWQTRWWSQDQFREMLTAAGFGRVSFRGVDGGRADPDAQAFVALAQR